MKLSNDFGNESIYTNKHSNTLNDKMATILVFEQSSLARYGQLHVLNKIYNLRL